MIRHGRRAATRADIAAMHAVSFSWAKNHAIWNQPGHPAPISGSSRHSGRGRTRLWDWDQAAAFAEGTRIPALPHRDDPADLLDIDDVATLRGVTPDTVSRQARDGYLPPHDDVVHGMRHWRRDTLEQHPPVGRGYRTDRHQARSGTAQQRVYETLNNNPQATLTELARQAGVSRPHAVKWSRQWRTDRAESEHP